MEFAGRAHAAEHALPQFGRSCHLLLLFNESRRGTTELHRQNSQVAASCEGIIDTITQGRRFRLGSRLTRVTPPLRRLNRGVNIFLGAHCQFEGNSPIPCFILGSVKPRSSGRDRSDLAATSQGSLLLLNVGFQDVDGAPPRNAAKQDSDQRRLSSSV